MKQLDVVVSPPAFVWNPYLTLTHVNFVTDRRTDRQTDGQSNLHRWAQKANNPTFEHTNFFLLAIANKK